MFDDLLKACGMTPADRITPGLYRARPGSVVRELILELEGRPGDPPRASAFAPTLADVAWVVSRLLESGYHLIEIGDGGWIFRKDGCPDVSISGLRGLRFPSTPTVEVDWAPDGDPEVGNEQ